MIWCLHGFLGKGKDWEPFRQTWEKASGMPLRAIDLFDKPLEEQTPELWGTRFARSIATTDPGAVLVGYSLGGRLALQALLARPGIFRGAVIVSASLGVDGEVERQMRRVRDDAWAARFETETWESVIDGWNGQAVFGGDAAAPPRDERDYDRSALATALRYWSPAVQQPIGPRLAELELPTLWVAGERDGKYVEAATRAAEAADDARLWIAPGAGHRVPWEAPEEFERRVADFLATLAPSTGGR
ncbi:MAG: alpha/beta fold hydrolase [Thermoanaerobaculia bacterium]